MKTLLSFTFNFVLILCSGVFSNNISRSSISRHKRIAGGDNAVLDSHPWVVHIYAIDSAFCGGSLLSDWWILTAARCFFNENDLIQLRAVAGEHNLENYEGTEQIRHIRRIERHPRYDVSHVITEDIALMRVTHRFHLNDFVKPINLPNPGSDFTGGDARLFGFGEGLNFRYYDTLQAVTLVIDHYEDCNNKNRGILKHYILCAASEFNSGTACNGDAGAGLEVDGTLAGVLSSSLNCRLPSDHVFLIHPKFYVGWISAHTGVKHRPEGAGNK